jgi:hypothetical protein
MSGLRDSKWAIPGVDPIRDRKARGLPGTADITARSAQYIVYRDARTNVCFQEGEIF